MNHALRIGTGTVLLVCLMLASRAVFALGLGNATVESFLGQPLSARIDLITRAGDDLGSVSAGLASADDFELIGANRETISVPLRFAIEQTGDGAFIRVTSNLPVKDPVIRLIVEVNWSSGRMLREYTLFLDPPSFAAPAPAPAISSQRQDRPVAAPVAESSDAPAAPVTPVQPDDSLAAESPAEDSGEDLAEYGPVQSGDTLWGIASDWSRGRSVTVNQAMIAIQRNNPQAFINDNINLLRRGAILRMPAAGEFDALSPAVARAQVMEQTAALSRPTAAAPAVETPLVDAAAAPPPVVEEPALPDSGSGQLEIVPPAADLDADSAYGFEEAGARGIAAVDAGLAAGPQLLREELARTEEDLISQQQENDYLRDRIAELESRLANVDGSVVDQDLAQLEERLREQRVAGETVEADVTGSLQQENSPANAQPEVPQVLTAAAGQQKEPWYSGLTLWLLGIMLVLAAVAGWLMTRRSAAAEWVGSDSASANSTMKGIRDEAQEILQVLRPERAAPAGAASSGALVGGDGGGKTAAALGSDEQDQDEAEFLDEDSADPEVRLDLARAYISMGDKEAARAILDEVTTHGSEQQQAEARSMLKDM